MDDMTPEANPLSVRGKIFDKEYSLLVTDPDYALTLARLSDPKTPRKKHY